MAKQPYLPKTDEGKVTWLNNFAAKKASHAATFGFTPAQVTATNNDAAMWAYIMAIIKQDREDMKEFTAYKNILRDGPKGTPTAVFPSFTVPAPTPAIVPADIFLRVSQDVEKIKSHNNYTTALGNDFGIIGSASSFDPAAFKASIKAKAEPGQVRITFVKSETDGCNIYARLEGQAVWTFLALDTSSPYLDTRPLANAGTPEKREYRGRNVIDNVEIGDYSDVAKVTFGG